MNSQLVDIGKNVVEYLDLNSCPDDLEFTIKKDSKLSLLITGRIETEKNKHISIHLSGDGACASIRGSVVIIRKGLLHLTSVQHHDHPDTTSDLLIKCVLSDNSSFFYNGIIAVSQKAQKTDAYQRNENLLVSPHVYCDSKPTLEILANDVRCTHGATSGPISEEELWYIMSRGVSMGEARALIIAGFLTSVLSKIEDEEIKKTFEKQIWEIT